MENKITAVSMVRLQQSSMHLSCIYSILPATSSQAQDLWLKSPVKSESFITVPLGWQRNAFLNSVRKNDGLFHYVIIQNCSPSWLVAWPPLTSSEGWKRGRGLICTSDSSWEENTAAVCQCLKFNGDKKSNTGSLGVCTLPLAIQKLVKVD